MVRIANGEHSYEVGRAVASTATYRLYLAQEWPSGEWRLLQIAATPEDSGGLDRAAHDERVELGDARVSVGPYSLRLLRNSVQLLPPSPCDRAR